MRLINVETLRLETFHGSAIPKRAYAILSHTWGKTRFCFASCERARIDGYKHIWIDTCCIDKTSSAELSEAINCMFLWYHHSAICYAYLVDLNAPGEGSVTEIVESRWFTRGWTLQELIAPRHVLFFDHRWEFAGTRQHKSPKTENILAKEISQGTSIPFEVLCWLPPQGNPFRWAPFDDIPQDPWLAFALDSCRIAQKMSWAAHRSTTREEDETYSLLGLFDVNIPMLYGEGPRAFFRLQQEVMKISGGQSILAFARPFSWTPQRSLLAESARCFANSLIERPRGHAPSWPGAALALDEISPSTKAAEMGLCLCPLSYRSGNGGEPPVYLGILNCVYRGDVTSHPAILLKSIDVATRRFYRVSTDVLRRIAPLDISTKGLTLFGPFRCE